jgi:RNA polymerase sigma-70 factor (ECF subfamily)
MTSFDSATAPYRRELLALCYRMLGAPDEAEDVVQETYLRAWRGWSGFEGRSSVRSWLYRIATNACLTALERRGRRPLPSGLAGPSALTEPVETDGVLWLQPFVTDPADVVTSRESLRLALIASLQYLPPRQRAVLILREVLDFPAAEVAAMLDTTVAAIKSSLQRARATLGSMPTTDLLEPDDPAAQELLDQYVAAFENSDTELLERALRKDAALEMVGSSTWFSGNETCLAYIAQVIGTAGDWRMRRIVANGQPAVVTHYRGELWGVAVLSIAADGISRIVVWSTQHLALRVADAARRADVDPDDLDAPWHNDFPP